MLMMMHADGPSRCWIDSWPLHHVNVKPESARKTTLSTYSEIAQSEFAACGHLNLRNSSLLRWPLSDYMTRTPSKHESTEVMLPPYSSPRPSRNKPPGPLMAPAALVRPAAS